APSMVFGLRRERYPRDCGLPFREENQGPTAFAGGEEDQMHKGMRRRRLTSMLALLASMLGIVFAAPMASGQGGNSSITVHNRICPVEYDGTSWFEDCHDTAPDPGLPFTFVNEDTGE